MKVEPSKCHYRNNDNELKLKQTTHYTPKTRALILSRKLKYFILTLYQNLPEVKIFRFDLYLINAFSEGTTD